MSSPSERPHDVHPRLLVKFFRIRRNFDVADTANKKARPSFEPGVFAEVAWR